MVDTEEPQGTGPSDNTEREARPAEGMIKGLHGLDKALAGFSALLIAVVGLIAFSNALSLPFHLDDRSFLVENEALHRVETVSQAWDTERLRPIAALSLALNWSLGGGSPGAFHLVNVMLHLLNGIIVFLICSRMLGKEVPAAISMVAGMIFVAHPALTQAVNHLPARSVLLGTTFLLLCVLFFLRGIQKEGKPGYGALALSLACFALAWGTDAAAWVAPFLLVFVAVASHRRESVRERAALFAPYVLLLAGLFITADFVESGVGRSGSDPLPAFTQARALGSFIPPTFVPIGLLVEHPPYQSELQGLPWLWAMLVIAAGVLTRFAPVPGMALLWYLFAVFAQGTFAVDASFHEERLYLPLAGLVLIFPWALSKLPKSPIRPMAGLVCALLIIACVVMTLTRNNQWRSEAELWIQANESCPQCYRPVERLARLYFEQGERTLRSIAEGEAGLDVEAAMQDMVRAHDFFVSATQFDRADARVWNGYARTQQYLGDPQGAAESLKNALRLDHDHRDSLLLMAEIYTDRAFDRRAAPADLGRAIEYLRRAAQVAELPPEALARYAALLTRRGDLREGTLALSRLQQAGAGLVPNQTMEEIAVKGQTFQALQAAINSKLQEGAEGPDVMALRARQLQLEGRYITSSYLAREAIRNAVPPREVWAVLGVNSAKTASMEQFLWDWPTGPEAEFDPDSWRILAGACASTGEWPAALRVLTHLRTKTGDDTSAMAMLASLASDLGDLQRAAGYYQQAINDNPEDVAALLGLADLLLDRGQADSARSFISQAESKGAPESELKERKERAGIEETDSRGLRRTIIR
ncbi:MAG: tetratricopeptide repeat protein [Candidatus Hydrogenedentes bacterium]|nr:tetratricopeptide repeat protein [Candidatus Hydrogenedentota bacterium]